MYTTLLRLSLAAMCAASVHAGVGVRHVYRPIVIYSSERSDRSQRERVHAYIRYVPMHDCVYTASFYSTWKCAVSC